MLFKLGSYDANPAAMSLNQGLKLITSGDVNGTTLLGELEYKRQYKNGLDGDYRFGVVRSSLDKTKLVNNANFSDDEVLVREHEYPIELNYNYVVTPAIQLMPNIQYIIDPNGDNDAENAVIAGLQLSLNF